MNDTNKNKLTEEEKKSWKQFSEDLWKKVNKEFLENTQKKEE